MNEKLENKGECEKSPDGKHKWVYPIRLEESLDRNRTLIKYCDYCFKRDPL